MALDPLGSTEGDRRSEETRTLCAKAAPDGVDGARLFDLVYAELRRLAARCLAQERPDHTLQPTALVHEAYLELIGHGEVPVSDKHRFLAVAAQAMRHTLIDHARGRNRAKRGGGWQRVELDVEVSPAAGEPLDLEELDHALDALRAYSEELVRLVELRFFAGLPMDEVAEVLGLSERSAGREWAFARAWLQRWLEERRHGRA